ncbi:PBSX family phage terminase large subunit [Limosilactobacillus reuteri]|uniref:PBSX family phage terminase large subunit n=5 Tax=Limosilactobacillus reuteri TaxID=1598 RepID=UPI000D6F5A82|nr:PBSX family phage terminase large subunit [Limosilactobacillus reuteri]PWT35207.1 PBSX family phage terminase large subunit [Limosilactobacillus reuteri]PWT53589.1 PBSX family phage terminase large subunit [Limosilactobacillus reuteri]PWT59825.1 PBSX family phage terminase large subunit [Limosilactobacillus reuteri]PWT64525.1 PBSX family phage terminase large subunit [Limosilactobacillus reuteri]PWT66521.1 PBSX family phage terminase large subunit [Limosilactobacillus reuteri]
MPKIKMSKMINPHFYKVWNTNKPYIILNGGRGSFKSSVISLKLATMVKKQTQLNHQVNFILIRENASYLHDSVYKQMEWAFTQLNMYNEFLYFKSPMRIVHKRTGSTFYFYGGDDPMKLKSNIVGNVMAVWYEEAANFKGREVFDQANPTFIRQKPPFIDHVTVYYSYNPPKSPYDWVNEWVEEERKDPDCLVDTSTYLDDERGFTNKEQLKLIERYKKNDYDYYRWLYLGEVVGLGTNIYNMENFQAIDKLPDDDYITNVYYSVDTGHEVSATTCGAYGLTKKGNVILLDTYYYSPQGKSHKKPPSELSKDLKAFIDKVTEWIGKQPTRMTIDSAEGALDNQFYNDYGIHWHKVNKLKKVDMIDRVQDLLAQGRFYYLQRPENDIFIAEHRKYQWDENTLQSDDPKVIKEDDHTCDSFMYLCVDNERDFGLKW